MFYYSCWVGSQLARQFDANVKNTLITEHLALIIKAPVIDDYDQLMMAKRLR